VQFYDTDGIELEIQDPKFFVDEDVLNSLHEAIEEMLTNYV